MFRRVRLTTLCFSLLTFLLLCRIGEPEASNLCARSAILINAADGQVLFEQNADTLIPPASVTKILTLYLVFDAIKSGQVHPWDVVKVSRRAANTGGSRMGLRAGKDVPLEELIKGIAVVSGNDAAVAVAEHLSGNVENFVSKMNIKARELGMVSSEFMTPNGLPAKGQLTTARDLAKLSLSYIRHYPDALHIHSMTSYTYNNASHHNANRLLGACPGVDGIKTGFVCASGFNLSATAKRGDVRLIAVVLGARAPWVRTIETERLLESGFQKMAADARDGSSVEEILAKHQTPGNGKQVRLACAVPTPAGDGTSTHSRQAKTRKNSGNAQKSSSSPRAAKTGNLAKPTSKTTAAEDSCPVTRKSKTGASESKQKLFLANQTASAKKTGSGEKSEASYQNAAKKKLSTSTETTTLKQPSSSKKQVEQDKTPSVKVASKPPNGAKQKHTSEPTKKNDKKS